eukprot:CAMPEP_0119133564 /NCGR_PEP_ID=MMETSP1310-20130426/13439_1 /TAXON_ID=464262 /ORGANISM="Genus nov. species nov., Strain RCC2339" /LENGTH=335 /DNA_ID=CAMNT_0007124261 /DNA_START=34 /DNA_END=1041 /DNA_ORIENTATION=-
MSIIDVPFSRRVQTFFTALWLFMIPMGTGICWMLALLALFFPLTLIPTLLYLAFIFLIDQSPSNGSRRPYLRYIVPWRHVQAYFPIELRKTVDLSPDSKYVFGYHPHGVISMGALVNFGTDASGFSALFPGIVVHVLTLRSNFLTPLLREFILHMGICEASLASCLKILARGSGSAIMLAVGGAAEALDARPGSYQLTLKNRKGFVRVALRSGASLVPVMSFGENELWDALPNPEGSALRRLQDAMKKAMRFTFPAIHGRGIFNYDVGWMPHRRRIVSVVGHPIHVDKPYTGDLKSGEGAALVDKIHAQYMEELAQLFEKHREELAPDIQQLVMK